MTDSSELSGLQIVYEDRYLLVVDKPAGLVVHPAPSHKGVTLVELLAGRSGGGDPERPGIVHRLDRDTSGLMVVAKDNQTHTLLQKMIRARTVVRSYIALVEGTLDAKAGVIDAPIGRDIRDRKKISIKTHTPRSAVTHFEVDRFLADSTLVTVKLETGRTHQIRAHFASIGHPVVGDKTYGKGGTYGLTRQFLHSARLEFQHPRLDKKISLSSDLPTDLSTALLLAEER